MTDPDKNTLKERELLIASQYSGVCPIYEAFYIHSIMYAAERSEMAFQRFDEAVAASETEAAIVGAAQEGLTHAGALSRFFWPVRKESQLAAARGARLRHAFALDDNSALKWRKLRNAFEHFDEDLDRFLLHDRVGFFFPGPKVGNQALADEAIGHIFKLVDPKQGICVLLGQKFEFIPIRSEVQRILSLALKMSKQGGRLFERPA